jgi:hypothetical protein
VDEMLEKGVIQKSNPPVSSPVDVQQKDKARFCVDLREVNAKTKVDIEREKTA